MRLQAIGYRLAAANADRCARPDMLTGLMLHDLGGYQPQVRPAVTKALGLTYGFGVRQLVPGGSGERAGIQKNDEILAIGGVDLGNYETGLIGAASSYDRTERFVAFLGEALRQGPAVLTLRRGTATVTLTLTGEPGCGGQFVLVPSRELNAWADGRYVAVTTKMLHYAKFDDELAFVVAHEMSHNILRHDEAVGGTSALFAQFGIGAKSVKADEMAADAYAIKLLAGAGIDLSAPERFLRRSGKSRWMDLATTHPGMKRRVAIVNAAITDVAATRSAAQIRLARQDRPAAPSFALAALAFDAPACPAFAATSGLALAALPAGPQAFAFGGALDSGGRPFVMTGTLAAGWQSDRLALTAFRSPSGSGRPLAIWKGALGKLGLPADPALREQGPRQCLRYDRRIAMPTLPGFPSTIGRVAMAM